MRQKESQKDHDSQMVMLEARVQTFQSWPFMSDCSCTPQKMAEAGFYSCGGNNEPDLVRCYFCRKELVRIFLTCSAQLCSPRFIFWRTAGSQRMTLGRSTKAMPGKAQYNAFCLFVVGVPCSLSYSGKHYIEPWTRGTCAYMNLGKKPNELTAVDVFGTLEVEKHKKMLQLASENHDTEVRANLKKTKLKINKLVPK